MTMHAWWMLAALLLAAGPAATLTAAEPARPAGDAAFVGERAKLRQARQELARHLAADRAKRAALASSGITDLIAAAEAKRLPGQDEPLGHLLDGLARLDPAQAQTLRERLARLPAADGQADPAAQRVWESTLKSKRSQILQPLRAMAQRAITLGEAEIAGELMQQYLCFWPDDPVVRGNMGLTRVRGRWYGPKTLPTAKQGLDWDERLGWVVASGRDRYEAGEYYDLEAKRWTTLSAANEAHAAVDKPWTVITEHLELRGNARLEDLVSAANRLEAFYARIFSAYAAFFADRGKADLRLVLGMAEHPRLVVNIQRTRADYQRTLPVPAGTSAGMYIHSRTPASYFYVGSDQVMFHEFTHQILGVFSGGTGDSWIVEGVAVYTQAPVIEGGALVLGRLEGNSHIRRYFTQLRTGGAIDAGRLMALTDATWEAGDVLGHYAAAGAFVHFCMEADERARRADFIDYLADNYRARAKRPLWDYIGTSRERLVADFAAWAQAQEMPAVERRAASRREAPEPARPTPGELFPGPEDAATEATPPAGGLFPIRLAGEVTRGCGCVPRP